MDAMFLEIFKISPIIGVLLIMWFYQRKDYTKLVEDMRADSKQREDKMQLTIDKNQEIIGDLANKFDVIEEIKDDVQEIKKYIFK